MNMWIEDYFRVRQIRHLFWDHFTTFLTLFSASFFKSSMPPRIIFWSGNFSTAFPLGSTLASSLQGGPALVPLGPPHTGAG